MIRLRFSTEPRSILSALIRWRTDSKISHVEFEREDGWTLGSRFCFTGKLLKWLGKESKIPAKWLDGVWFRPPSENCKQGYVIHATFEGIEKVYEWVRDNRMGCPYNFKGILGLATARDYHCAEHKFCSEIVYEGAESVGIYLQNRFDTAPWQMTPRDLLISPFVTELK